MSGPWPVQLGVPPPKPGDTGLERERERRERGALQRFNFDSKPAAAQGRTVTPTTVNFVNISNKQSANFISAGIKPSDCRLTELFKPFHHTNRSNFFTKSLDLILNQTSCLESNTQSLLL